MNFHEETAVFEPQAWQLKPLLICVSLAPSSVRASAQQNSKQPFLRWQQGQEPAMCAFLILVTTKDQSAMHVVLNLPL